MPQRKSKIKSEYDEDSGIIDSCEEDKLQIYVRDECDIDSNELQEDRYLKPEILNSEVF